MTHCPKSDTTVLQAECDRFNLAHPVGTPVTVQLDGQAELFVTATRSPAQVLSGHSAVIWLENLTGCYLLNRVRPIQVCTEMCASAAARNMAREVPAGFALVPCEVNDAMLAAFTETACTDVKWDSISEHHRQEVRDGFAPAYQAMLVAASSLETSAVDALRTAWPQGWTVTNDGESWTVVSPDGQTRRWFKKTTAHDDSPFMWAFLNALAARAKALAAVEVTDAQIDAILDSPGGMGFVIADKRERLRLFARRVLALVTMPIHAAEVDRAEDLPFGIIDPDYARAYTKARIAAWEHGYAIALQGSFTRDLDLVAVPWTDNASDMETLTVAIEYRTGLKRQGPPSDKPHGRRAVSLLFPEFEDPRWVDLSVLPRVAAPSTDTLDTHQQQGLAWAIHRWMSEVNDRPLVNIHRRSLDDAWRQVVVYFGGDPMQLLGPDHDSLLAAQQGGTA